jgi:hypothetical protein
VALRLVYLIFIRLLGALALLIRSDVSKDAEGPSPRGVDTLSADLQAQGTASLGIS